MKIIILKSNLSRGLSAAERGIGLNTNLPILKSVFIKAEGNRIILTATDLELAVQYAVSGKVIENGAVAVPFSVLNTIVKNLNAERVTLEYSEKRLAVSSDNYEAFIQGQDIREFPLIPSIQNSERFLKMDIPTFRDVVLSVIPATQYSDIRPEISGVYFSYENGQLVFVATDSFRLAERKIESSGIQVHFDRGVNAIIPFRTAEEVLRVFEGIEEDVQIFIDANQLLFKTETAQVISRRVDGNFPEYKVIIPQQIKTEVVANRSEFMNAVKLISSFSGRGNDIKISVGDNGKYLELYAADSAIGENRYRIPAKTKGDTFSIVFNWRFVLDGLKIFKGDEIFFGVNAPDKPAVFKSPSQQNLLYIVMPIKA